VSDRGHLRALLAKMIENVLRVQANHHHAQRRDLRREVAATVGVSTRDTVLDLDPTGTGTAPDQAAERTETRDWVRLALQFLDADDRDAIVWRDYDELSFAEVAARLGVAEDAARMRYRRALPKLARALTDLRAGRLDALL
jgi:RNA polymerase sigma factor (sigma-70 family)